MEFTIWFSFFIHSADYSLSIGIVLFEEFLITKFSLFDSGFAWFVTKPAIDQFVYVSLFLCKKTELKLHARIEVQSTWKIERKNNVEDKLVLIGGISVCHSFVSSREVLNNAILLDSLRWGTLFVSMLVNLYMRAFEFEYCGCSTTQSSDLTLQAWVARVLSVVWWFHWFRCIEYGKALKCERQCWGHKVEWGFVMCFCFVRGSF